MEKGAHPQFLQADRAEELWEKSCLPALADLPVKCAGTGEKSAVLFRKEVNNSPK